MIENRRNDGCGPVASQSSPTLVSQNTNQTPEIECRERAETTPGAGVVERKHTLSSGYIYQEPKMVYGTTNVYVLLHHVTKQKCKEKSNVM